MPVRRLAPNTGFFLNRQLYFNYAVSAVGFVAKVINMPARAAEAVSVHIDPLLSGIHGSLRGAVQALVNCGRYQLAGALRDMYFCTRAQRHFHGKIHIDT